MRHLRNIDELIFWSSLSCLLSFLGRSWLGFVFPSLLIRIGLGIYVWIVVGKGEDNVLVARLILTALILGMVGGYWDAITAMNIRTITTVLNLFCALALIALGLWILWEGKKNDSN